MYVVVYQRDVYNENNLHQDFPSMHVYYCKKKKIARKYIEKRITTLVKSINRQHLIIDQVNYNCPDYKSVEYRLNENGLEYPYVFERFEIVRASEILDLPNGPSLKVE